MKKQDAEDVSSEIILRAYRALLAREDIEDYGKFIWTIAHNYLSNYYRDSGKMYIGGNIEDMAELPDPEYCLYCMEGSENGQ